MATNNDKGYNAEALARYKKAIANAKKALKKARKQSKDLELELERVETVIKKIPCHLPVHHPVYGSGDCPKP